MAKLYIIPTPIGNLEDLTYRAARILRQVDLILAEDTRNTKNLLDHYQIQNRIESYHKFNEHKKTGSLVQKLMKKDKTAALVSDSGSPGISDPGYLLVSTCLSNGMEVETLPGPTAFIPALINSGLPCDRFVFEGFLPHKKGRKKRLEFLANETRTIVLYESPYRLLKTLQQLVEYFGESRRATVSRELTKIHEENIRGTLKELINHFEKQNIKGEIVIIVEGKRGK
ncbi:MAG: 16S rRNA (cytidine(1402)-2'-O)-methyltransferase [Bacteroidales bacterium]|nr:16S rRNA (cytidine(1402)-2'-O)-methyltransferase [Bacteroidales bacterium]